MRLLALSVVISVALPVTVHGQCDLGPIQRLVPSGAHPGDWTTVPDVDGNFLVIGALFGDGVQPDTGAAYIYEKDNFGGWVQRQTLSPTDLVPGANFGKNLSLEGDLVAIGATYEFSSYPGAVYLYRRDGAVWELEQKLEPSDYPTNASFGSAVFVHGDQCLVGAFRVGRAYVFERINGLWIEQDILESPDPVGHSFATHDLSILGDVAVVGSRYDNQQGSSAGAVIVFKRIGTSWVFDRKLLASDGGPGRTFGWWIEMDLQSLIVGAPAFSGSGGGAAYIFERQGNDWTEVAKLTALDATPGANFGYSTAICGDWAAVGARWGDAQGQDSGGVYLYQRTPSGWELHRQLLPQQNGPGDQLFDVALDGATLLMGALADDGETGAGYVVALPGGEPVQASFTVSQQSGKFPLTVHFSDTSTGGITSWLWNFGNGYLSTVRSPVFTYHDPGLFTVTLTVSGPCGTDVSEAALIQVGPQRPPNTPKNVKPSGPP